MRHSSCLTPRSSEQNGSPISSAKAALRPSDRAALALIRTAARDAVRAATPEQAADIAFGALINVHAITLAKHRQAIAVPLTIGARCMGGWFAGINGHSQAVILLPGDLEQVDHHEAADWAGSIGGVLPTLAEHSLLIGNFPCGFGKGLYWASDLLGADDSAAWHQSYVTGRRGYCKRYRPLKARAIRRVALEDLLDPPLAIQSDRQERHTAVLRAEVAHG